MFAAALLRTIYTLKSPDFIALLIRSALFTLIGFAVFMMLVVAALHFTQFGVSSGEFWIDLLTGIGTTLLAWFLLPVLLPAIAACFQETIAGRIEAQDYKALPPAQHKTVFWQDMGEEMKFLGVLLGLNLLCLPLYLIPVINLFTYYTLNAYLVGREFFETAAARRIGRKAAKKLRQSYRLPTIMGGLMIVLLANVPIANLAAPFIGVAYMVHLFHLIPAQKNYS